VAIDLGADDRDKRVVPQMNVTPLVDVVLVLLIIFMVITPLLTKTFWVHTPKQEKEEVERQQLDQDPTPPLVLHIGGDRVINVNGAEVPFAELPDRLRRMFAAREDHILFFDAADDAEYGFAVEVMDQAREGGAVTIAALTTALQGTADGAAAGAAAPADAANPAAP
jgi:biopolymer transport protein ExbD/biopolymer transport protein TolR